MGQSSSAGSKSALPSNNLLIDASDSYVTDVKLRSTAVIPISEYIKKDKNSKRLQHLKKNVSEDKIKNKPRNDKTTNKTTNKTPKEEIKKEKKRFLESSFEDIPNNRKWISIYSKSRPQNESKNIKNPKIHAPTNEDKNSAEEIKQIYKNKIYPHIYKNKYNKKTRPKTVPAGGDNIKQYEESTHQLNKHQYQKNNIKKHKQNNLSVQTNVACVIHPDRQKQPNNNEYNQRKKPNESSSYTAIPHPTNDLDKITKSHRKYLSGKQALENWKNIHTLKQHRKLSNTNYYTYPEEYEYINRSRAGFLDEPKMTPLEISNYNYSNCISPKEIKERNEKLKRSPRNYPQFFERDYCRKNEREERIMEREDFIEDMERCLRQKIASVYGRTEGRTQTNKTTWVQDKYRRWHKVLLE